MTNIAASVSTYSDIQLLKALVFNVNPSVVSNDKQRDLQ